jgi:hypothetical protein
VKQLMGSSTPISQKQHPDEKLSSSHHIMGVLTEITPINKQK